MADEEGMDALQDDGDWNVNPVEPEQYTVLVPQDINPMAYSKYPLQRLVQAAYDGDLVLLEKLLDREDPTNGYHHDINAHLDDFNALHAAAMNGQLEVVKLLLKAGADPHIKQSMPHGSDPRDGETAREMAEKWGWDDVVLVLKSAEAQAPKGVYLRYGTGNNSKLWPIDRPEGLDPDQEKRAKRKHKSMARPLPSRVDRKFYGELVFGVTHGWDQDGNVIKTPRFPLGHGPLQDERRGHGDGDHRALSEASRVQVGLLFPNEGSHYVGMLTSMQGNPRVQDMLAKATQVLGYDVLKLCLEGPMEELEKAEHAQPVIYVASLAALEKLRSERPEAAERPMAVAGLEVGEFAALAAAGFMSFETGLRLVQERAAAMAHASQEPPQGTLSVAGLHKEQLESLCEEVQQKTGSVCQLATELFPKGCTCAGALEALRELKKLADDKDALQTKLLEKAGAHTSFMESARQRLEASLLRVLPELRPPSCDVYMNTTGKVIRAGTDPRKIVPLLCDQLTSRALWDTCVRAMVAAGVREFYEVGPMKQLKAMMKRIDPDAWSRTESVDV